MSRQQWNTSLKMADDWNKVHLLGDDRVPGSRDQTRARHMESHGQLKHGEWFVYYG
jgi:hypothetical protein